MTLQPHQGDTCCRELAKEYSNPLWGINYYGKLFYLPGEGTISVITMQSWRFSVPLNNAFQASDVLLLWPQGHSEKQIQSMINPVWNKPAPRFPLMYQR